MQECSIPSAFIMGMLWACTKASIWCRQWPCAWLAASPWLYLWWPCCTPTQLTLTICVALRWQYVWHMSVIIKIQAHSSSWLVAGLQYLQCIWNGDAAVLHKTINRVYGQCPGACLAPGHCLYLWWPYIYPWNWPYVWNWCDNRCDTSMSYANLYIQVAWCRILVSPVY